MSNEMLFRLLRNIAHGGIAPRFRNWERSTYKPGQPRDSHGRFTTNGDGASNLASNPETEEREHGRS